MLKLSAECAGLYPLRVAVGCDRHRLTPHVQEGPHGVGGGRARRAEQRRRGLEVRPVLQQRRDVRGPGGHPAGGDDGAGHGDADLKGKGEGL